MSPFTARVMEEANMRPAVLQFEADDRGIPICQSFDRLAFEQRTLFGIFKKYEISFMLRTIMSLDRQLRLHFAAFQRLHGLVVQIDFGLAALIDHQLSMHPLGLLNDSTVRTLVLVAFRVLGGKGLSRKGHGKSEKYDQAYARKHKIYSSF